MSNSNDLRSQSANDAFAHAFGTEEYHKYALGMFITDGVLEVAQKCQAFMLIDEIVNGQLIEKVRNLGFQAWKLNLIEGNSFNLSCDDGNENVIFEKEILFPDFPYNDVTIWIEGNVLLLPSEH